MAAPVAESAFERFLYLVGRLHYAWSNTESVLIHYIAGLARCDKETATLIFLTLGSFRARLDLVERLAKLDRVDEATRAQVLELTRAMGPIAAKRNRLSHAIYAFDGATQTPRTIEMRVADRKDSLKLGATRDIDAGAVADIEATLADLSRLNVRLWDGIRALSFPV